MDDILKNVELARLTGRDQSYFSYLRSGKRRASPDLAERLEEITGVRREAWLWPEKYENPYIKQDPNHA